jgi:acyl-CoA thioesterase-1
MLARHFGVGLGIVLAFVCSQPLFAASFRIVAFGASDTEGKGVSRNQAYPAQLEAALRSRGYDAEVVNAGVSGDTTAAMLARLDSSVPPGTQLIIYQPGGNDWLNGIPRQQTVANISATLARLRAKGMRILMFRYAAPIPSGQLASQYGAGFLGGFHMGVPASMHLSDGQHMTPQGYSIVVQRITPVVVNVIGRSR